jgi:hypothetical protein
MLDIEIISCPDPEYQGNWCFHKNCIYLGSPEGDICFEGFSLSFAFMIEVLPSYIQVTPHPKIESWKLNGKRATKSKKIRISDLIEVCDVQLKVVRAEYIEGKSKKQILDEKLKLLIAEDASVLNLIQVINPKTKTT